MQLCTIYNFPSIFNEASPLVKKFPLLFTKSCVYCLHSMLLWCKKGMCRIYQEHKGFKLMSSTNLLCFARFDIMLQFQTHMSYNILRNTLSIVYNVLIIHPTLIVKVHLILFTNPWEFSNIKLKTTEYVNHRRRKDN